jgi:(E)-4-hydroxy-3-methylbut-2-enyl-diphosphate synthase
MGYVREATHQVCVGGVLIGGGAPISVQSMTNLPMVPGKKGSVLDEVGTGLQIAKLAAAGCEIVRVAVPNEESVAHFARVAEQSPLPVVADIHFDYALAVAVAKNGADKLRINPGNIGSLDKVDAVIDAAGEAKIPIRIGVNAGSLDEKWCEKRGAPLAERLAGSAIEYVAHFKERGFADIVVSAKASDVLTTVEAYRIISRELPDIPLHLGITEAGTLIQGTVKSAVGIGMLLADGIGDTVRVSLTEDPLEEITVGWRYWLLWACVVAILNLSVALPAVVVRSISYPLRKRLNDA